MFLRQRQKNLAIRFFFSKKFFVPQNEMVKAHKTCQFFCTRDKDIFWAGVIENQIFLVSFSEIMDIGTKVTDLKTDLTL